MSCPVKINVKNTAPLRSVELYCGSNKTLFYQIINVVGEKTDKDGVYTPSSLFKAWYKKKYHKLPNFTEGDPDQLKQDILDCYNENVPSINDTLRDSDTKNLVDNYGYTSASARDDGKRVITSFLLDLHIDSLFKLDPETEAGKRDIITRSRYIANDVVRKSKLSKDEKNVLLNVITNSLSVEAIREHLSSHNLKSNFDIYGKNVDYYKYRSRILLRNELIKRIMRETGGDAKTINQVLHKTIVDDEGHKTTVVNMSYANAVLGGKYISLQDKNLLATYTEALEFKTYFDELMYNSKLDFLRNDRKDEEHNENEKTAVEAEAAEEGENEIVNEEPVDDDADITIGMYDHSGVYRNFMTHVNKDIKAVLDSIPMLNTDQVIDGEYDYNLDNALGIKMSMDANQCATVLYHYANTNSVDDFVKSIENIANNIPGMGGFVYLAKFLKDYQTAAFAFYSVFGKKIIDKAQLIQENEARSLDRTNKRSNRLDSFTYELQNSARGSVYRQDFYYNKKLINEAREYLNNNQKLIFNNKEGEYAKTLINKVVEIANHYYSTIDVYAIQNFVYKNTPNIIDNFTALLNELDSTVKASEQSQKNYDELVEEILENKDKNGNRDWSKLYAKDYLTSEQRSSASRLAKLLVDYSLIKVESNSINPMGNQSSDVINSSFITGMMQVLRDRVILGKYGNFKFQSQQYNFSNILLEERDENDRLINYGLFRRSGDEVVPTEYATDLLSVALYDGARNYDEDKGITYPNHSKNDYITAQFSAFTHAKKDTNKDTDAKDTKGINYAGYFMRTPADAPKNFVVYAPKYSASDLFSIKNLAEVNERRKAFMSEIQRKGFDGDLKSIMQTSSPITVREMPSVINHVTSENITISLPDWTKQAFEEGKEYDFILQYKSKSNDDEKPNYTVYKIKGTYSKGSIINGNFAGFYKNYIAPDVTSSLKLHYDKQLEKEGIIERDINTNSVLFVQLKRMFRQELLDAAIALNKFFVTDKKQAYDNDGNALPYYEGGMVLKENGQPVWRDGVSKNGREVDGAYDNYHHKKGVIVDENGKLVGNVFHSDKFTVFDEENNVVRNYGEELIEEMFDFLYGGGIDSEYLHTIIDINTGKIKDIKLTEEQEAVINGKLAEFVEHLIKDASERLENMEDILGSESLTTENITEFILNYHIMYNNFNELFEGDSKFYKDSQTFLKRAKESQGSGVPYGIANFAKLFDNIGTKNIVDSPLASVKFKDREGNIHEITQYDKFCGVTVVNTVTSNQKTLETILNKLVKTGVKQEDAERLMRGFGYKNPKKDTTVNDAQSYITFEEWVRRITARGQLNKYKPLINKVYRGEELNGAELNEFIQVQKNFYYDQNFDTTSSIFAPRQIKNAEFVLIPQLIKGTQLEVVAKLMEKYDIDQLNTEETSKAGKTNTLSVFDSKTGEVHQDIIDEINDKSKKKISKFGRTVGEPGIGKQLYSYEFLYTQQETPQHLDSENKAGIQIMKKIIDNITPEDKELYEYKKQFIACYTANIRESAKDLFKELNIPVDFNGNPSIKHNDKGEIVIDGLKYSVFYDKLKSELFRLGYDSNMIDYVTLDAAKPDENGNVTIMPNYMSMVGQKLESIAQSIFNNSITRQKLPGFHAAQITNVGFKATNEQVSYSHELRYHTDEKGNYVDYIEIMLPASAFHFKRRDKNGKLKSKEDLLKELQDAGIDEVIGYRIPTEGKQSVCKMKVVGFIDDGFGSTIVVPNEWVAQTGSDFDIDSVYGIQHSTYIDKDGKIQKYKYNDNVEPEFNDRNARNNEILDCMMKMLCDDSSLEEILSRSNFEDISHEPKGDDKGGALQQVAPKTFMNRRNGRSVYNVLDQADYQEDTMSGAKLKGFSVTRDNFCSICNTVRPTIGDSASIEVTYSYDVISYKDAVKRFGEENVTNDSNNRQVKIKHNRIGWSLDNKNVVGKILTAYSSQTTAHILDAVKEGSVPNVNDFTFGVYKLFPDLGIDYVTAISFMMQKGVTRIVNAYNSTKSVFINDNQQAVYKAIRQIAKELELNVGEYEPIKNVIDEININYSDKIQDILGIREIKLTDKEIGDIKVSSEDYIKQLKSPVEGIDGLIFDLGVILQYNKFKHLADHIGKLARVCNPDKFGAKRTIFATNKVFDEINEITKDVENQFITVQGRPFLTSIYPDIDKGIEGYMKSTNNNSAYPILHTFLKYSTAPSVIINRTLFRTQSEKFINFVNGLELELSNGSSLTETQYKALEKYIVSGLYYRCNCLTLPYNYNKRASKNIWIERFPKDISPEELEGYRANEISRIFGYRSTNEPMITIEENGEEKVVPFEIKNVANPNQREINAFAELTPAQKVVFIQEHFRDAGVFNSFNANLYNTRDIAGKKAGSQTIEFIEGSISNEDAYLQIRNAFSNRNPLIALAAYDLIKYAFVVEGYKMSKRGISKVIPNSVLHDKFGITGIGLVEELNELFVNFEGDLQYKKENPYVDFVRSHTKLLRIPHKRVTKVSKDDYELKRNKLNGLIRIPYTEDNMQLLEKYKITYQKGKLFIPNNYVRLTFDKDHKDVLYRIKYVNSQLILYPLDYLEENEHGLYSSNSNNRNYPDYRYYESIISELDSMNTSEFDDNTLKTIASNYKISDYKRKSVATKKNVEYVKDINFEHPSKGDPGIVDHIKTEAQEFYKHESNRGKSMFMLDRGLASHFIKEGRAYRLEKQLEIIHTKDNVKTKEILPVDIYKLKAKELLKSIQPYLGEGRNKEIDKKHQKYVGIINQLRTLGITKVAEPANDTRPYPITITPIVEIKPNDPSIPKTTNDSSEKQQGSSLLKTSRLSEGRNATVSDVAGDIYRSVNRVIAADAADVDTLKVKNYWKDKGITFDKNSINDHLFDIVRSGAEYITKRVESITNQLKYFMEDPEGDGYIAVNDPAIVAQIYKDPELRNRLLKLILEAEAIVKNNMAISELDIQAQDSNLQAYLNKIKEKLQEIQNSNIINEAQNLLANEYLKAYSTNPLVRRDLLNILNGFYSSSWFESWIGDLQETPNPMLQVIAKEVTSDLFAKRKLAQQKVKDFDTKLKELRSLAAKEGLTIDWKHIVDDDGRVIQNYSPKLLDDMYAFREKVSNTKEAYKNGNGSYRAYVEARLEYDKWKLAHINQELKDDYYRRKIAIEEEILYGPKVTQEEIDAGIDPNEERGHADVYVAYKELEERRREIYSHVVNGYLDPYYLEELDKVNQQIADLIEPAYTDPITGKHKPLRESYNPIDNPLTGTPEEKRIKLMYSSGSQMAIQKYIRKMRELDEDYFKKDAEFGFDEELSRNIHIISSYEKRDANGNITIPLDVLMDNPEYVVAKQWIAHNAVFVMHDDQKAELNKAFATVRSAGNRKKLNSIIEAHNAKDELGVIDARSFTEAEIKSIKEEQTSTRDYHEANAYSDRNLIKNSGNNTVIYTRDFYANLQVPGTNNAEWYEVVGKINKILEKYWDNSTKTIRFDLIPDTEEGINELKELNSLYTNLQQIKKKKNVSQEDALKVKEFREKNVDSELSDEELAEYNAQVALNSGKSQNFRTQLNNVFKLVVDGEAKINYYVFGSLRPKKEVENKWIDKEKTKAINLINQTYTTTPTEYYYMKVEEMRKQGTEAFRKWYYENHIYNPSTRNYEPIRCWNKYVYRDTSSSKGEWMPKWMNKRRSIIETQRNEDYVPKVGHAMNYKTGTGYDNPKVQEQNKYEKELKTYVQDLLYSLVHTDSGLAYLNKGYLPSQHRAPDTDAKLIGKELLKALGWTTYHSGKEYWDREIGYDTDKTMTMPMLTLLEQRTPKEAKLIEPVKEEGESDEDFAKRKAKYEEEKKKLDEENTKAHREALNKNWEEVLKSFIIQASHFNAIQENKYMLFYGQRMLERLETYASKYGGSSDFEKDYRNSTDDSPEYIGQKETNLMKQYENWVRRIVYDQWKEPRDEYTKWASRLQSLTSAQYMMMNIRGGIANVTLGATQIVAEAFAKEYLGGKAWAKGIGLWNANIISMFANRDKETAETLGDAIIKWFDVVDYDENVGKSRFVENPTMKGFNKFNRAMYSPQTIGENYMQNSVLFAMLYDHKVFEVEDEITGEKKIVFKNLEEHIRDNDIKAMLSILNDEQKQEFNNIVKKIKEDANEMKDYAWYKKDFVHEYAKHNLDDTQLSEYRKARKTLNDKSKDEFDKASSIMDQIELKDGYMAIKADTLLGKYNTVDGTNPVTNAMKVLSDFRGRVISVNKKIHGVYDKLGQAQLEKKWWGSLAMQYHKHIWPGIMKRWRVKGMYNEARGTIEKGSHISLLQFLATPIEKLKHAKTMSDGSFTALKSVQTLFKEMFDFCFHIGMYYDILPEYEQANIRRAIGDMLGIVSAILFAMALHIADDDDKEDSILFNIALYEADRLASESFQFNPVGMTYEAKQLWSTPIAAQSGLQDLVSTMGFISDWMFDEDFDPNYSTGRFAGQNKFVVRLKRRIPIYRGIYTSIFNIGESNKYYKNNNVVDNILEWVDDEDDDE